MKKILTSCLLTLAFCVSQTAAAQTIMASEIDFSGITQCPKDIHRAGEAFRVGQLCITKQHVLKVIPSQKGPKANKNDSKAVKVAKKIINEHKKDLQLARKNLKNIKQLEKKLKKAQSKKGAKSNTTPQGSVNNKHLEKAEIFLSQADTIQTATASCQQQQFLTKTLKSATKHLEKACTTTDCSGNTEYAALESRLQGHISNFEGQNSPSSLKGARQSLRSIQSDLSC